MNRRQYQAMKAKLEELAKAANGDLKPSAVLAEARKKTSVLHRMFEWNDTKAAEKYRLFQARELIASVQYVYVVNQHKYSAPMYVRNPEAEARDQGYVSLPRLRSDAALAREALASAFANATSYLERAYGLAKALEFEPQEVKAIADRVGALASRVSQNATMQ
jgi:hypothetical protein